MEIPVAVWMEKKKQITLIDIVISVSLVARVIAQFVVINVDVLSAGNTEFRLDINMQFLQRESML
jgi:hypothetical protein